MKIKTIQLLLMGLAVLWGARAQAQDSSWAEKMFDKLDHDFGVVARGADTRYRLKITNKYQPAVHIASVTTTCGCTAAKPSKDTLASLETAYIEITMDTKKFQHQKDSSLTIVIDQPLYASIRIPVKAYIRSDVVLSPGGAAFDAIAKGADAERKIGVAYAGRANWKIKDVVSKNPNIVAKYAETRREGINVNYDLNITVKADAPLGEFREQLTIVTDDAGNPYIPLLVEGRVESDYAITPEIVSFGNLTPGQRKTVNITVRGKAPFVVEKIESETTSKVFEVHLPKSAQKLHVLPLTVIAPAESGPVQDEFTVTISGRSEPLTF